MLENITRHIEMGSRECRDARRIQRGRLHDLVVTVSLVAVFIPCCHGRYPRPAAARVRASLFVAVLISGFGSLTLDPDAVQTHAGRRAYKKPRPVYAWSERAFNALLSGYRRTSRGCCATSNSRSPFFRITLATGVCSARCRKVPAGRRSGDDPGIHRSRAGRVLHGDASMQRQVAEIVKENPSVQGAMSSVGAGGPSASLNVGRIFVALKRADQRRAADVVIPQLRGPLARVTASRRTCRTSRHQHRRAGHEKLVSVHMAGTDTNELYQWAPRVEEKLRSLPDLSTGPATCKSPSRR